MESILKILNSGMNLKTFTHAVHKILVLITLCFCLFILILFIQVNKDGSSWVEPVTKLQIMCLAHGHNTVTPPAVSLELATLPSAV